MRTRHAALNIKQLAQVTTATALVAGMPVALVWWLRVSGALSSVALAMLVGMALSLCVSFIGCVVWEARTGSQDLLFSELMIWGFVRRWHTQRRLASAREMLAPLSGAKRGVVDGLSTKEQAKLLEQLVAGMETRDPYLHGHSRRVARHSWMIARRMGLQRAEVARIRTAAAIHDVGKIETPTAILHKAGPLTDDEYGVIKKHPGDGAQMAAVLGDAEVTSMVRHHHERLDGSGYPGGLAGDQIPLGARIIAVADTFDAITSARPYRPVSPHKRAMDILREEAGTRLDPAVVRAFCGHYAGRGPLALWSFVAGLPERAVAWLGSSAATVTSAAKVAVVAALVGGVAATSATLGVSAAERHRGGETAAAASPARAARAPAWAALASAAARTNAGARHVKIRPGARGPKTGSGPATASAAAAQIATAGIGASSSAQSTAPGAGEGDAARARESTAGGEQSGSGERSSGGREEAGSVNKSKASHGKSEEAHAKKEEASAAGKSEEAHAKKEEASAAGNSEEAHAKKEEASGTSKSEEAHAKKEEASAAGNSEEAHAKKEEASGTSKSEEAHVKKEAAADE